KLSEAAEAYKTRHLKHIELRSQAEIDLDALMQTKPAKNSSRRKISSRAKQVRRTSTMPPKSETLPRTYDSQTTLLEVPKVPIVPKLALSQEKEEMQGKAQEKAETSQPIVHIQATHQVGFQPRSWKHQGKSDMQEDSEVPIMPTVPKSAVPRVVQETSVMQEIALEEARTSQSIVHIQSTQSKMPIYQVGFQPQCWKHQEKSDMQEDSEVPIMPTVPKSAVPRVVQEANVMQEITLEEARQSQSIVHIQSTQSFQPQFCQPQEKNEMQDDCEELDVAKMIKEDKQIVQVTQKELDVCT
ncbi:hypothetical protein HK096_000939, partial [Nowakowskiella sp. JEL0078]